MNRKLLTTNLSADQAEILFYLSFFSYLKIVDTSKVEVFQSDDDEFSVGHLNFLREAESPKWVSGVVLMTSAGSYYEPPDYDFAEVYVQAEGERLSTFVLRTVQKLIEESFENAVSNEAEAAFDYQFRAFREGTHFEDIPF